jgi:rSAM/selenodomain-associated transferase 1
MPTSHATTPITSHNIADDLVHYIVFARFPERGKVKTRLAAHIGEARACALYEAMLKDTLEIVQSRTSATNADVLLCVTPDSAVERFQPWLRANNIDYPNVYCFAQQGATLGERMFNAFRIAEDRHALPALILGTDSPTIPDQVFTQAEQALQDPHTAVLGKTDDGGFYMMGLHRADESFFLGGDYSNDTVYERTLAALQAHTAHGKHAITHVEQLPVWYDVDDMAGIERLRSEAQHDASLRYFHTLRTLMSWQMGKQIDRQMDTCADTKVLTNENV